MKSNPNEAVLWINQQFCTIFKENNFWNLCIGFKTDVYIRTDVVHMKISGALQDKFTQESTKLCKYEVELHIHVG